MPYRCSACGHTMKAASAHGGCAACGSATLKPVRKAMPLKHQSKQRNGIEVFLMLLLWGLLAYGVYEKFFSP